MPPRLRPLPDCDGPKLEPFTQNFEDLKFELEKVIKEEWGYAHGIIIKAKLDGKTYAIKFVRSSPPPPGNPHRFSLQIG